MRRGLMFVAFAAIFIARFDPSLLRFPFQNRAALAPAFDFPQGEWRQYSAFLREVREHTRPGERVLVLVPPQTNWEASDSYAYYRASYVLTGREVLPFRDESHRAHPANLAHAELVAAWHTPAPPTHAKVVWAGEGGVLVRR